MKTTHLLLLLLAALSAQAGEAGASFHPQTGEVTVGADLATITVPEGMFFLPQAEARHMLEKVWKNPPDPSVIGMVVKESADEKEDEIVVVVSYDDDGHVDDSDARGIDYAALLTQMQEECVESNEARKAQGFETVDLLGWAEPPHYDAASKKVFWAKDLRFGGAPESTLNYCIRILGRKGVLELNAIGQTAHLAQIAPVAKQVMAATDFKAGNRYADYQEGVDLKQAGGVAGLIVGGIVAKKLGLIALIGLGLLKFAKILIIPLILLGGWLFSWFKRRRSAEEEDLRAQRAAAQAERVAARTGPPPAPKG